MASPALEIAQKTSDASLQIWAALLIKGQDFSVGKCYSISKFQTCSRCLVIYQERLCPDQ